MVKSDNVADSTPDGARNTLWPPSPMAEAGSEGLKTGTPPTQNVHLFQASQPCPVEGDAGEITSLRRNARLMEGLWFPNGGRCGWSMHSSLSYFTQMLRWLVWWRSCTLRLWLPNSLWWWPEVTVSWFHIRPMGGHLSSPSQTSMWVVSLLFCLLCRCRLLRPPAPLMKGLEP